MNRFLKNTIASGIAALAVVGSVGAVPALAGSQSAADHGTVEHNRNDPLASGPSGRSDSDFTAFGSGGYAMNTVAPAWPMAAPSDAAQIDRQIRHLPAGRFNIVHVDLIGNRNAGVISDRAGHPHYLANLHRSIDRNRPLLARLERQHVEIRNIIGAEPGGNGSMTFYVE